MTTEERLEKLERQLCPWGQARANRCNRWLLAGLTETALEKAVGKLEKGRGEAYPPREQELKGGRPLK